MGLQCSILGHAFEDAGVERERTEQGSEVVTTEREIERCRRCGKERVVSESTEVAAVVDASDVDIDDEGVTDDAAAEEDPVGADESIDSDAVDDEPPETGGGLSGAIERSTADEADEPDGEGDEPIDDDTAADAVDSGIDLEDAEPSDPAEEDAEILTDENTDEPDRQPGQWPDEPEADDDADDAIDLMEDDDDPLVSEPDDRSLSGITVPEGEIICPDCSFSIEANSGYRAGDPCPDCNAWLEAERNQ